MVTPLSAADLLPIKPEFVPLPLQATIEALQSLIKAERALMIRMASQPGMGKKARQEAAAAHALRIHALQTAVFRLLECP